MFNQSTDRLRTIRDVLRFAVSRFGEHRIYFGHGTDNAWDEAVYLVMHSLHLPPGQLEPYLDATLCEAELATVLEVLRRRAVERLPAAYITGEAWLGEYRFAVDPRVIVPRSFIAELLFEGLAPWVDEPQRIGRVLDLCTGSGCLAIVAADVFPNAKVDAIDVSGDALAVARQNVESYALADRVKLIESDLFAGVRRERYDLILSNPPYVTEASMQRLPEEYRREPALALAGGDDGLDLVRTIIGQAATHLSKDGLLIVEVGHERASVEAAFPELPFTWLSTAGGDDMVFMLERKQLQKATRTA